MSLTAEQKSAMNQLKETIPTDLVPGFTISSSGSGIDSDYLKLMKYKAQTLTENALYYSNEIARSKSNPGKSGIPKKILSAEGFPPWVTVTYYPPAPNAFYVPNKEREVRYFVFHSYGHAWHATVKDGKNVGWLNALTGKAGVETHTFGNQTVYIAKNSDPDTLSHFTRISAGLSTTLKSSSGVAPHFFIDRSGNLVVIGDCNSVQWASNSLNKTSVGVELEEAFYVLDDTKAPKNKAIFKPGGNPPGTAGNVKYFAYSPQQLLTLAIVCKKIEMAFPQIRQRNVTLTGGSGPNNTPPGYIMHLFIKGSKHFDISPHYLTRDMWNAFFKLVDAQKHITAAMLFTPPQRYKSAPVSQVSPLSKQTLTSMSALLLKTSKEQGLGTLRIEKLTAETRKSLSFNTANASALASLKTQHSIGSLLHKLQQAQQPIRTFAAKVQPLTSTGKQIGSDDFW